MKPRFFFLPIASLMVALILFAATIVKAEDPPVPQVVEVDKTVQGKNVDQWQKIAARYLTSSRHRYRAIRTLVHQRSWGNHWLERAFLCIHSGEGAWNTNTHNGFYGGLQMDYSFQRSYAPWALAAFGTADHWPVSVQIATAIRAKVSGRGFYPWPNTARGCGLL